MKKQLTKSHSKENAFKITSKQNGATQQGANPAQPDDEVLSEAIDNSILKKTLSWLSMIRKRTSVLVIFILWPIAFMYGGYLAISSPSIPIILTLMLIGLPFTLLAVWFTVVLVVSMLLARTTDEKHSMVLCYSMLLLPLLVLWAGWDSHFITSVEYHRKQGTLFFLYSVIGIGNMLLIELIKRLVTTRYSANVEVSVVLLFSAVVIVELYNPYPEVQITTGVTQHCYEATVKKRAYRSTRVESEYEVEECFTRFTYDGKTMKLFLSGHGDNVTVRNGLVNHYRLSD